jgi:hypothetical protein
MMIWINTFNFATFSKLSKEIFDLSPIHLIVSGVVFLLFN